MPAEENNNLKKESKFILYPAIKVKIKTLLTGEFVQEEAQNYLLTENQKIYRLNLIAVIIKIEKSGSITNILADDGSGEIILRVFEENKKIGALSIGDIILTVGRIRKYNQEKYISPEIIKKISLQWLKVRALEFKKANYKKKELSEELIDGFVLEEERNEAEEKNDDKNKEREEKEKDIKKEDDCLLPIEKLKKQIMDLDNGTGVLIEELIENSPIEKIEELIDKMLKSGDIFQNAPGRIKVL